MMETTIQSANGSIGREDLNGSHLTRPRASSDREPTRKPPSIRVADENRAPSSLPKAFESMLKTTTETGEIGLFSIKPSRVPPPLNTPRKIGGSYNENGQQKPQQSLRLCNGPVMADDRKRLPSYTRDASSEVISMYETASQKSSISSRIFEDPDYRSYSMTQTSYSSYTLSNHKSYASLRSQPEGNLLQRPRSPFAYPTRLKRPGFRPSSPALTDGGGIDYSRRAEIDRIPHVSGHGTSSPASLYAQKRVPLLGLRSDANRSTPSLLSQSSPPRRCTSPPSPPLQQRNGTPGNEWPRRNGPASGNASPARSTLNLAATVNLYQPALALSTTTTPGKLHPPSPLYYDYTEDFDIDDYNDPETIEPLPPFRIDETIPKDRPLSSEWPSADTSDARGPKACLNSGVRITSSAAVVLLHTREGSEDSAVNDSTKTSANPQQDATGTQTLVAMKSFSEEVVVIPEDKKGLTQSHLCDGTRDGVLPTEGPLGFHPSTSSESSDPEEQANEVADVEIGNRFILDENEMGTETLSKRSSSYNLTRDRKSVV